MDDIRLKAWFPKEKRTLHFKNAHMCDEYDTLSFDLAKEDKTIQYQWLAGKSYIPNSPAIITIDKD